MNKTVITRVLAAAGIAAVLGLSVAAPASAQEYRRDWHRPYHDHDGYWLRHHHPAYIAVAPAPGYYYAPPPPPPVLVAPVEPPSINFVIPLHIR